MNANFSDIEYLATMDGDGGDCVRCLIQFVETRDMQVLEDLISVPDSNFAYRMATSLWQLQEWGDDEEASLQFVVLMALLKGGPGREEYESPLESVFGYLYRYQPDEPLPKGLTLFGTLVETGFDLSRIIALHTKTCKEIVFARWSQNRAPGGPAPEVMSAFEEYLWNQDDSILPSALELLPQNEFLLELAAISRPAVADTWLQMKRNQGGLLLVQPRELKALIRGNSFFDGIAVEYVRETSNPAHSAPVIWQLAQLRWEAHSALCREFFSRPEIAADTDVMKFLCGTNPELALIQLGIILKLNLYTSHPNTAPQCYSKGFRLAAHRLSEDGLPVFQALLENGDAYGLARAVHELTSAVEAPPGQGLEQMLSALCLHPGARPLGLTMSMLRAVHERLPGVFVDIWWQLLDGQIPIENGYVFAFLAQGLPVGDSGMKHAQNLAVSALAKNLGEMALAGAEERLSDKKTEIRIGATALLTTIGTDSALELLQHQLTKEENDKVRAVIHEGLKLHGALPRPEAVDPEDASKILRAIEAGFAKKMANAKLPPGDWWRVADSSGLKALDGSPVSAKASEYLVFEHSRLKAIETAPDTLQLIACLDKKSAADIALSLLNVWLAEGQDSKHRWVLALAGTLGDTRIISTLLPWIPKWCEAARHKLAEYAAQGISLLGSNEALMVLDTLASRYRSKFRNVGAAAAAAFQSAAQARGISPDELGDLVVPSFDFNEDGQRRFEWDGGAALAELTMDLKLEWSDPDSEKSWKTLPVSVPDAVKAEVKELGKLLRETGKAQALRLEQALVKQRRWPVAAWQELYEKHPLLRAYATRLVWGVYDAAETFQRAFRRYPNGILADASGAMEELPECEARIGLLHPLDLEDAALNAWQAHLARFKVQPPFPQLDRPVERLEPNLHNRRMLSLTEGREISYGTFRSRAEKRGWTRGSVIDAGGISSYYKLFPGAGVEVSLETRDMYVGMDPIETLTLGPARFCTAGSIQRGTYVYDEPAENDPRLLTFGQVPPVVYSETVSDLKAIIAQKEPDEA